LVDMKVIKGDDTVFFDVDDTLILWHRVPKPNDTVVAVTCFDTTSTFVVHQHHVDLLNYYNELGKTIVVWSQGGWEWAKAVVEALHLQMAVDAVMTKPTAYVDDLDCKMWIGARIYKKIE
jgi:hypothetical protein